MFVSGTASAHGASIVTLPTVTATSIENLYLTNTGSAATGTATSSPVAGSDIVVNATNYPGLTQAWVSNSTGTATNNLNNLAKTTTVGLQGQVAGAVTAGFNGVAATDTINVALDGVYGTSATANASLTLGKGTSAATADVAPTVVSISGAGGRVTLLDSSLTSVSASVTGTSTIGVGGTSAPTLRTIDLSGSTGAVTLDLATVSNAAALSSTASVVLKGGAGADTFNTIVQTATATTGTLANFSKSLYTLDGGAGADTLQLSNIAATAGVADAFVLSTSGVAAGTGTANSAILSAINNFANLETLQIIQRDTQTTAATTAQAQGAVSIDVAAVTSVKDFAVSTSVVTAAGTGGSHVITGSAGVVATSVAAGSAITFTSLSNDTTISITGRATGGAGGTSTTAAGGNAADALALSPLVNNGSNALTLTLKGVTITGGAGGSSTASTAKNGGNGGDALDFGNMETITVVSSGTATNVSGSYSNTLAGGAKGTASTGGTDGTAGFGVNFGTSTKLVVTGTKNIDLGTTTGTTYTIDASALSGDLKVSLKDTSNNTVIGGSGANAITIAGGQFYLDLSASATKVDTIDLSSYSVGGTSVATTVATIKGVGYVSALGDKIDVAGTAAVPTSTATGSYTNTSSGAVLNSTIDTFGKITVTTVTGTASLTDVINAAFKALPDTTNSVGIVEYAGSSYLIEELGNGTAGDFTAGTDLIIKLDGLVGLTGISTTAGASGFVYVV